MSNWSITAAIQNAACEHLGIGCRDNYTPTEKNTVKKTDDTISFKIPKQEAKKLNLCGINLDRGDITDITVEKPVKQKDNGTYLMTVTHWLEQAPRDYDTRQLTEYCAVDGNNYEYGTERTYKISGEKDREYTFTREKRVLNRSSVSNSTSIEKTTKQPLVYDWDNQHYVKSEKGPEIEYIGETTEKGFSSERNLTDGESEFNEKFSPHYVCTEDNDCKLNWFTMND